MSKRNLSLSDSDDSDGQSEMESVSNYSGDQKRARQVLLGPGIDIERVARELCGVVDRTRVLHDIIPIRGDPNGNEGAEEIAKRGDVIYNAMLKRLHPKEAPARYHGAVFLIAKHYKDGFQHIHVVHDCNFANSACKCAIMAGISIKRRTQRPVFSKDVGYEFWYNKLLYLLLSSRGDSHFFITTSSRIRRLYSLSEADSLRYREDQGRCKEGENPRQLYALPCEEQGDIISGGSEFSPSNALKGSCGSSGHSSKRGPRMPTSYETKQVFEFLKENLVVPPVNCAVVDKWFLDGFLINITPQDKTFEAAVNIFHRYILKKNPIQIYKMYLDKTLYFLSTDEGLAEYHSRELSKDMIMSFLMFQFFDDKDQVIEFLSCLYKLLIRDNGKKNALWLKGVPDCGKSWFIRILEGLCITVGKCSVMNRTNAFPLSSCVNVNLIVLDELSYEPEIWTDRLKLLFSGDPLSVSVKYQNDRFISKTPIIIASNGECIPWIPAFQKRIMKYTWNACTLDIFFKSAHPFALIDLWEEYGMVNLREM